MPQRRTARRFPAPRLLAALALLALAGACAPHVRPATAPATAMNALRAAADETGIPVLTWHGFADSLTGRGGNLTASYAEFERMLGFLRQHGFRSVFPGEVRPGEDRGRMVVLTFDDGSKDHLRAAEILERYGFRGIFFVIPNRIQPGHERHLTPDEVRQLVRGGHRVAAHGYEHRSLGSSAREVAGTVARSRGIIAARADAGAAGEDFAFPFGHYSPEVAEAVAGRFRYLHTVDPGYWDGRSALVPRMLLMNDVDPALFEAYVLGGAGNLPSWEALFASGGTTETLTFLARGAPVPAEVELFAISPDAEGRPYASHPLGESLRVRGDTVWVDMGAHLRRYFPPERTAVSYALVTREGGRIRYLTPGLLHWVRDRPAEPPGVRNRPRSRPRWTDHPATHPPANEFAAVKTRCRPAPTARASGEGLPRRPAHPEMTSPHAGDCHSEGGAARDPPTPQRLAPTEESPFRLLVSGRRARSRRMPRLSPKRPRSTARAVAEPGLSSLPTAGQRRR